MAAADVEVGVPKAGEEEGALQRTGATFKVVSRESLGLIADAYCNYYCFFASFTYFLNCMWWSFLNPENLGLDPLGIALCALVTFILPLCLECRCYLACVLRFQKLLRFLPWLYLLPTVADPPLPAEALAVLSCLATTASLNNIAAILCAPDKNKNVQRAPWALLLGLLILLGIRLAWFSYNPFMDFGWMPLKIVGLVVFGLGSAAFLWLEEWKLLPAEDTLDQAAMSIKSSEPELAVGFYKKRKCWIWMISGWTWFAPLYLTMWLFNSPYAVGKFAGDMTTDDGTPSKAATEIIVVFCIIIGAAVAPLLARLGIVLEIVGTACLIVGGAVLVNAESVVGGFILALGLPSLWWAALHEVRSLARQGAVGRTLFCSGFIFFFFVLAYVGVITCSSVPLIGGLFCGNFSTLLWSFAIPTVIANILLLVLDFFSKRSGAIVDGELFAPLSWARNFTRPMVLKGVAGAIILIGIVLLVPAVIIDIVSVTSTPDVAPLVNSQLHVMAYNNQNGYDMRGVANPRCSVELLERDRPDVVVMPEGDSSHLNTGNSDAWLYLYRTLGMYGTGGLPGYVPSVGLGVLSARPFSKPPTYVKLPKAGSPPEDFFNRPLVISVVKLDGVDVTVFGVHLEWFGNPTVQVEAVAKAAQAVTGPLVIAGDFNLEPDGLNTHMRKSNGTLVNPWPILESLASVVSASPLTCDVTTETVVGRVQTWCRSEYSTVMFPPVDGYQLDYVFYRGLKLAEPVRKVVPFADADVSCSDHRAFSAKLELP